MHDNVDFVSEEGRIAARGAAEYLRGKTEKKRNEISLEGNIHSCIPQEISTSEAFSLYLRVKEPLEKGSVRLYNGTIKVLEKRLAFAIPSEMVRIDVPGIEYMTELRLEIV